MRVLLISTVAAALALSACKSSSHNHTDHDHAAVCEKDGVALAPLPEDAKPADAKTSPSVHFGGAFKLTGAEAVAADKVFAAPADYRDKYVRITGKVSAVCPKRGCWLRVVPAGEQSADAQNLFIKFRDPSSGMLIPLESVGKDVIVEGTLKIGMISEAAARHFKEDAGAPQAEIEKIVGPQKQMVLVEPAVEIQGVSVN